MSWWTKWCPFMAEATSQRSRFSSSSLTSPSSWWTSSSLWWSGETVRPGLPGEDEAGARRGDRQGDSAQWLWSQFGNNPLSLITSLITTSPWNMATDQFTSYHHYFHPLVEEGDSTMQTGVSTLNISNFFLCLTSHSSFLLSLPIINIFHFMRRQLFWTQPLFPHGALYYQPAHDNDNFQVLASECCDISYNDLDLIFTVDLPTQKHYERVSVEETEKQSF